MAKEIVNANAKIHVLADETLGGIKREYVEVGRDVSARRMGGYVQFTETPNLEPTDIIHIGTQRYELTDRKAEVGEKVIIVALDPGLATESDLGKVTTVTKLCSEDDIETAKLGWVKRSEYRVLVPVEAESDEPQPSDPIFAIGNVAQEVAKLKRTVERLENEIDTLHKDNLTLGEELARLKESATGVKGEKLFTADELAAIIERLLMRP